MTGMDDRRGVLCIGTAVVDVSKIVNTYPPRDHLAFIESISMSTGGPAMNMAVDLRQLGADFPIELICAIGEDEHGAYILSECARLGVSTDRVYRITGMDTSFTDVMVERDGGRRTFFHHIGANAALLPRAETLHASNARILHLGAPGIQPALDEFIDGRSGWINLLEAAQSLGLHTNMEMVSLDPARQRELTGPCLPYVNSVIVNELEAGALTGIDDEVATADGPVDWSAIERMALGIIEQGCRSFAAVHTPAGAVAADASGRVWRQGSVRLPPDQVRGTTGAGDAFAAGVLFGVHAGWSLERCLELGAASAAACVMSTHTSAGIRPAIACLETARAFGFRETT